MSNSKNEDRDQQLLRRLANIEHRVDSLDQTQAFALRADTEKHMESVKEIFGRSLRRVQVYLAANGQRSVNEISEILEMTQPYVSRQLSILQNEGLLEVFERDGGSTYWGKKPIDKTLRISIFLMKEYGLDDSGLPLKKN